MCLLSNLYPVWSHCFYLFPFLVSPMSRSKKSYSNWQTRGKRWLTSGRTDGNGCDWVTLVKFSLIKYSRSVVIWLFDCMWFDISSGGAPVLTGRRCGWGVAAGPGALPVQSRGGAECGWGGEAHQEARGFREVGCDLGGAFFRSGEAYHGERPRERWNFQSLWSRNWWWLLK